MTEPARARLARALSEVPGVPREMIARAVEGYYDDYLSPVAFPLMTLRVDLLDLARHPATPADSRQLLRGLAERVVAGDFDASREESRAWAQSPEGQAAFRELLGGDGPPGPSLAAGGGS